jgi:group I intron endonuclease
MATKKKYEMFYVYKITNLINNKIYIGKTHNINKRWKQHIRDANPESNTIKYYIHKAINKYGKDNFIIEEIFQTEREEIALEKEIEFVKLFDSNNPKIGYNQTLGGDGVSGHIYTQEQRAAMSERMKGKFTGENNPFYKKKHSKKTKKQLSKQKFIEHKLHPEKYCGENNSQSILTEEQVINICNLINEGLLTFPEIAGINNTSRACITSIARGNTWTQISNNILIRKDNKKQSSKIYWNKNKGEKIIIKYNCKYCGKEKEKETRLKNKAPIPKFCSNECKIKALVELAKSKTANK